MKYWLILGASFALLSSCSTTRRFGDAKITDRNGWHAVLVDEFRTIDIAANKNQYSQLKIRGLPISVFPQSFLLEDDVNEDAKFIFKVRYSDMSGNIFFQTKAQYGDELNKELEGFIHSAPYRKGPKNYNIELLLMSGGMDRIGKGVFVAKGLISGWDNSGGWMYIGNRFSNREPYIVP